MSKISGSENLHVNTDTKVSKFKESVNSEVSSEITYENFLKGVSFSPYGDQVKLTYNGLLAKSGADNVYVSLSYGDNKNWMNTSTLNMDKIEPQIFELLIPAKENGQLNVAFKDSASNWDNNSGKNYCYYIS